MTHTRRRSLAIYIFVAILAWATPAIAAVVYTTFANVFTANQRINAGLGVNVAPGATGTISASGAFFERSRSLAVGEWTTRAFSASDYSGFGTMTWTLTSGDVTSFRWTLVGKTLVITFNLVSTTVGGTPTTLLQFTVPGGFTCNAQTFANTVLLADASVRAAGFALCQAATSVVLIGRVDGANFSLATNTTDANGQITVEVQ